MELFVFKHMHSMKLCFEETDVLAPDGLFYCHNGVETLAFMEELQTVTYARTKG